MAYLCCSETSNRSNKEVTYAPIHILLHAHRVVDTGNGSHTCLGKRGAVRCLCRQDVYPERGQVHEL